MNNALVYIHIFADGSKYFGNAVNPKRPFSLTKGKGRGPLYGEALQKYGKPVVQIRRNLSIHEADLLEQSLFDRYVLNGGKALQRRPFGNDLQTAITRSAKVNPANISLGLLTTEAQQKLHKPKSKEHAENISRGLIGNNNGRGRKGHKMTEAQKEKLRKPKSKETREKISKALKGNSNGKGSKRGSTWNKGKKMPIEIVETNRAAQSKLFMSMLDGRITTRSVIGRLNKKNPNYIGTWVDL